MKKLLVMLLMAACAAAWAAPKKSAAKKAPARTAQTQQAKAKTKAKAAAPFETAHRKVPYVGAMAVDAASGKVIFSDRPEAEAYMASVTKMMTFFLVMEDVSAGRYTLDTPVETPAIRHCEPSWVGLKTGEKMSVRDLALALMVESANDAALILGIHAAGSLEAFVARMNARAAELGMTRTHYYNPSGLPPNAGKRYPWKKFNVTTAADQVKLARALVKMPGVFAFTSVKTCDLVKTAGGYRVAVTRKVGVPDRTTALAAGETLVKQLRNHNNVMRMDKYKVRNADGREAVDGLKTGYIDAGGSSVVLTASRNGRRAIVVVLGSANAQLRDTHARTLMVKALDQIGGKVAPGVKAAVPEAPQAAAAGAPAAPANPAPQTAPETAAAPETAPAAQEEAAAAREAARAPQREELPEEAAAPDEKAPPAVPASSGLGFGLGLILGAVAVAIVAFLAWRWLGQNDRSRWTYDNLRTGETAKPETPPQA